MHLAVIVQNSVMRHRNRLEERGATAVEYALMVGTIVVGCIVAFTYFAKATSKTFNRSSNAIDSGMHPNG